MTQGTRELLQQALKLAPTERALLVAGIVASLDGDEPEALAEAAWADEIERRIHDMPQDGRELRDAPAVFATLRTHLSERRRL